MKTIVEDMLEKEKIMNELKGTQNEEEGTPNVSSLFISFFFN